MGERIEVASDLPDHLTPRAVSQTFAKALHAPAFVLLAGCLAVALTLQAQNPTTTLWPAICASLLLVGLLVLVDCRRTPLLSALYLTAGGAAAYAYMLTLATEFEVSRLSDPYIVVMPAAALTLVGGSGSGAIAGFRWSTAGFVVAQTVSFLAIREARGDSSFSPVPLIIYLAISLVLLLHWLSRRADWRSQPRLGAAERAEYLAAIRRRAEIEAAALTHDTILNRLAVISSAPTGPPSAALYDQLELDLEALGNADLDALDPSAPSSHDEPTPAPDDKRTRSSPLFGAIEAAQERGMTIAVTGDPTPVLHLSDEAASALALAVAECLTNVEQHSGVISAEVAIDASDSALVVIVIDAGIGFTPAEIPHHRLGVRSSIRGRIEAVGGTANVWSSPGQGTSVILRLPLVSEEMPERTDNNPTTRDEGAGS